MDIECRTCGVSKDESEFMLRKSKGYREKSCKSCRYNQHRLNANRQANLDRYKQTEKYVRAARGRVVAKYGMTLEEYESRAAKQNNLCAVCQKPETRTFRGKVRHLSVDHDHATGLVRGIICDNCNTTLGRVNDSVEHLRLLIAYLEGDSN